MRLLPTPSLPLRRIRIHQLHTSWPAHLTAQSPLSIRAEESVDVEMQRSNVTHAHCIDVLEFMQKLHRKERAG